MQIFPTRIQWKKWSFPSKVTYFSAVVSVVSLAIGAMSLLLDIEINQRVQALQIEQMKLDWLPNDSAFTPDFYDEIDPRRRARPSESLRTTKLNVETACGELTPEIEQLLEIRNIAFRRVGSNDHYRTSDLRTYHLYPAEVIAYFRSQRELILEYSKAGSVFHYYWSNIQTLDNWEAALTELASRARYSRPDELAANIDSLGIPHYPNPCVVVRVSDLSLEDWIISFWARRYLDGTADVIFEIIGEFANLDQVSSNGNQSSLANAQN